MKKPNPQKIAYLQAVTDLGLVLAIKNTKKDFLDAVAAAQKAGLKVECNFNSVQGENLPLSVYRQIK